MPSARMQLNFLVTVLNLALIHCVIIGWLPGTGASCLAGLCTCGGGLAEGLSVS